MTEYSPPNTFYSQTYGLFENEDMYKFIGKNGTHFKYLTTKLGLDYIWWNKDTNVIEIWGPHSNLKFAKKIMNHKMKMFMKNKTAPPLQRCNACTPEQIKDIHHIVESVLADMV